MSSPADIRCPSEVPSSLFLTLFVSPLTRILACGYVGTRGESHVGEAGPLDTSAFDFDHPMAVTSADHEVGAGGPESGCFNVGLLEPQISEFLYTAASFSLRFKRLISALYPLRWIAGPPANQR